MEKEYFIKQYAYAPDNKELTPGKNILSDLDGGLVTKIGIQAYPGLKFSFSDGLDNSQLIIGNSGVFELNLEGTGYNISWLSLHPGTTRNFDIIIDVMGFNNRK